MATQFKSSQKRQQWAFWILSYLFDVVVVSVILTLINYQYPIWLAAILIPLALQVGFAFLMFYGFLKRLVFFKAYDENRRINAYFQDFKKLRFPLPEDYYHDSENYLHAVAMDRNASDEARLNAGMLLGILYSQKLIGPRTEGFFNAITPEKAAQRYSDWLDDRRPRLD